MNTKDLFTSLQVFTMTLTKTTACNYYVVRGNVSLILTFFHLSESLIDGSTSKSKLIEGQKEMKYLVFTYSYSVLLT